MIYNNDIKMISDSCEYSGMECTMEEGRVVNRLEKQHGLIIEEKEITKAGGGAAD